MTNWRYLTVAIGAVACGCTSPQAIKVVNDHTQFAVLVVAETGGGWRVHQWVEAQSNRIVRAPRHATIQVLDTSIDFGDNVICEAKVTDLLAKQERLLVVPDNNVTIRVMCDTPDVCWYSKNQHMIYLVLEPIEPSAPYQHHRWVICTLHGNAWEGWGKAYPVGEYTIKLMRQDRLVIVLGRIRITEGENKVALQVPAVIK